MNGPLGEEMESMIGCDKVCLDAESTSSLLSCDVSTFTGDETPGVGIYDN